MHVNCVTTVPVLKEWTQYEVTDVNGSVQVAARKDDVNVERGMARSRPQENDFGDGDVARVTGS